MGAILFIVGYGLFIGVAIYAEVKHFLKNGR